MQNPIKRARFPFYNLRGCKLPRLASLIALIFIVSPAHAQSDNAKEKEYYRDWFQVEVIVFARNQINSPDAEKWPKSIALAYPPNLQLLLDPNAAESIPQSEAQLDATGASASPTFEAEQPFMLLDSDARRLNAQVLQLKRNRGKRVLFHEAWRQPMLDQDSSPAIVINGGEQFDKNYELGGTLTVWLSRYLHISTNLWLSKFQTNYGQETEHYPFPPEPPKPFMVSEDGLPENSLSDDNNWGLTLENNKNDLDINFNDTSGQSYFQDFTNLTKQPYVVSQVVTMQQRRRMRSTELHYLDHPLMGVLIQIDRYDPTEENAQ